MSLFLMIPYITFNFILLFPLIIKDLFFVVNRRSTRRRDSVDQRKSRSFVLGNYRIVIYKIMEQSGVPALIKFLIGSLIFANLEIV